MFSFQGLRVLNTRPEGQQHQLSEAIIAAGGTVVECPLLLIEPLAFSHWPYLKHLTDIDQMIFISTNAVRYFFDGLFAHNILFPLSIRVLAIGQATAHHLASRGIQVDAIPIEPASEDLLQLEQMQAVSNQTIAIVKGVDGRQHLMETLALRGAKVVFVDVYRRVYPQVNKTLLESLWHEDAIDVMIFTSAQAMRHFFALLPEALDWLRQKTCVVISERLGQVAGQLGIKQIIISPYEHLLATLRNRNDNKA